jgi:hypothetical protein
VFFFVQMDSPSFGEERLGHANCRAPDTHRELPPWVASLLVATTHAELFGLHRALDVCLGHFQQHHGSGAQRLLRSINWGNLPLVWRALFVRDVRAVTTCAQAEAAQARLVKSVSAMWEDAHVLAEAIELLARVTAVVD